MHGQQNTKTTDTLPHSQQSATEPDESSSQPDFITILIFFPPPPGHPSNGPPCGLQLRL